jgi:hypothetical protein
MSAADIINKFISIGKDDANLNTNDISDGYHTFGELYEHRISLYIKLCEWATWLGDSRTERVWRSKLHHDGSSFDGWFILGISELSGKQISYHLPISKWDECNFADTLDKAPEWDGHTSNDVLERLKQL